MPTLAFSSRRQPLQPEQADALYQHLGSFDTVEERPATWQVSEDRWADIVANQRQWHLLAAGAVAIAGDFPHAALEALAVMNLPVPVWVRVYKIGGGFVRDTEFVRWANLNPPAKHDVRAIVP